MQTPAGVKAELNSNVYAFATCREEEEEEEEGEGGFTHDDKRKSLCLWGTKHRLATPQLVTVKTGLQKARC